jgi:hypothetical protein
MVKSTTPAHSSNHDPYMLLQDEDVKIIENMMIQHIVKNT